MMNAQHLLAWVGVLSLAQVLTGSVLAHEPRDLGVLTKPSLGGVAPIGSITSRRSCGLKSPLAIVVQTRSTPMVGQELVLTATVSNGLRAGAVRVTFDVPEGAAEVVGGSTSTESFMALDATQLQELRLKILTAEPFDVTAKVRSLDPRDARLPPGESIVAVRPLNLSGSGPSLSWNPLTLRSKSKPAPPELRLRDGRSVVRIRIPTP